MLRTVCTRGADLPSNACPLSIVLDQRYPFVAHDLAAKKSHLERGPVGDFFSSLRVFGGPSRSRQCMGRDY